MKSTRILLKSNIIFTRTFNGPKFLRGMWGVREDRTIGFVIKERKKERNKSDEKGFSVVVLEREKVRMNQCPNLESLI